MYVERFNVSLTADGSGNVTGFTPNVTGRVLAIVYTKNNFAAGVDFVITAEATGEAILTLTDQNASGVWYPRVPTHDATGAAALYAAGGTAVRDRIALANDRVKIAVAQAGAGTLGTVTVIVG